MGCGRRSRSLPGARCAIPDRRLSSRGGGRGAGLVGGSAWLLFELLSLLLWLLWLLLLLLGGAGLGGAAGGGRTRACWTVGGGGRCGRSRVGVWVRGTTGEPGGQGCVRRCLCLQRRLLCLLLRLLRFRFHRLLIRTLLLMLVRVGWRGCGWLGVCVVVVVVV